MLKRMLYIFAIGAMLIAGAVVAADKTDFTADRHKAMNITCSACHGGEEQPQTAATSQGCLTCHKSLEAVAEQTKDFDKNPHHNHLTEMSDIECTQCHQGHKEDTIVCNQCHSGMTFEKRQPEEK